MHGSLLSLITLLAMLCGLAHAADASLETRISNCAAVREEVARLACFDAVAERLQEPPSSITSTLERVAQRPRGEYVFHLANGQVWTELEVGRARYQAGIPVTIERTTFGSYMLSTTTGRATRVRRVE